VTSKPDFKVMVLLLVFMQLTRDLFAIAKFLLNLSSKKVYVKMTSLVIYRLANLKVVIVTTLSGVGYARTTHD